MKPSPTQVAQNFDEAQADYLLNLGGFPRNQHWYAAPNNLSDDEYLLYFFGKAVDVMFINEKPEVVHANTRDSEGGSMLHTACIWGDLRAVQLLIKAGAEVDAVGDMKTTPLHFAVTNRYADIVAHLVQNGAQIELKNDFGYSPLETAIENKHEEILAIFAAG